MNNRFFTKSAFRLAIDCPTKLYYCCDKQYANQDEDNEFMQSLAKGGFQVGELAKIYYHISEDCCVKSKDYEGSLSRTSELFCREKVNIAEAAFRYQNYFVRADIIEKDGNQINLIEVKAKSYDSGNGTKITRKNSNNEILPYVQDAAFQKFVIINALKEQYPDRDFVVHTYLMMADKSIPAPVNGMNQYFKINNTDDGERITVMPGAEALADEVHVLTPFDVDEYCNELISDSGFLPFVERMADAYCRHIRIPSELSHKCFKCPFNSPDDSLLDGFNECWEDKTGLVGSDFEKPSLRDFSMLGFWQSANELIAQRRVLLKDLTPDDIDKGPGIMTERREILFGLETGERGILKRYGDAIVDNSYFLEKGRVKKYLDSFKSRYPLHFIDFETTATALPFYKGMKPYEDVAFQYSHHTVYVSEDGSYKIEHTNQFLNTEKGRFPNFDFVRSLRDALSKDEGVIFRYANHENKILRSIRRQLCESTEVDKEELIAFIDSITHSGKDEPIKHKGKRDMVDLEAIVKDCFLYPEIMKGRTSIKVVLPAVLNASKFLQEKYSKPIYGTEIKSCNYSDTGRAITWVKRLPGSDKIDNPYHELEAIEKEILIETGLSGQSYEDIKKEVGAAVANGGAALTAYSKLQYTDLVATDILRNSLFRYCELDTMAMVFIWEFFYNATR